MTLVKIAGVGGYLPEKIYDNRHLESLVDTSNEWIMERTGIRERHIAGTDELSSDLAFRASVLALKNAKMKPAEIDAIILATVTPDVFFPSSAVILQKKLGIGSNCFAFDAQAACSGFLYGLELADSLIKTGKAKNILLAAAETLSKITNWSDRSTCVLFGDGAGAVALTAAEEENSGIIFSKISSDGSYFDILKTAGGIGKGLKNIFIEMQGREVFKLAVNKMCESITDCLEKLKLTLDDVKIIIPHQANQRILESVAKKLNISPSKLHSTVEIHGNTAAASIPLALFDAWERGKIKKGDLVLFEALGAGLTWGIAALRW
ncbi:MAG: ketoacyl-ACP synthase III [Rickettsiales bacterium]|jgi:3-oxoacyl-[acyl-carrier-protein] synthase-3|nr:ketoacyl-ACP synthase III [Rickettsiales bacterium]